MRARRSTRTKRVRLDPDEARERILAAAERCLIAQGPDRIRVAEIARTLGITHPAILHHFGTREALVEAVVERALERRYEQVVTRLRRGGDPLDTARTLLDGAFDAFERQGTSRLVAWLALGQERLRAPSDSLRPVTVAVEEARRGLSGEAPASPADASAFAVHLGALVLLAEPLFGSFLWSAQGRQDSRAKDRAFRSWFASVLSGALLGSGVPVSPRPSRGRSARPRR